MPCRRFTNEAPEAPHNAHLEGGDRRRTACSQQAMANCHELRQAGSMGQRQEAGQAVAQVDRRSRRSSEEKEDGQRAEERAQERRRERHRGVGSAMQR